MLTHARTGTLSDYEAYLRCPELLDLQKPREERAHRDELLFQVAHQSSELWLKAAVEDICEAAAAVHRDSPYEAARLTRRASLAMGQVIGALGLLEELPPWDYTVIRRALGQGSGFDSPGFKAARTASRALAASWDQLLAARGTEAVEVYQRREEHEALYALAEAMVDWDEQLMLWRARHLRMVKRIIGGGAIGTAGTPVHQLAALLNKELFPRLWEVRDELTRRAGL